MKLEINLSKDIGSFFNLEDELLVVQIHGTLEGVLEKAKIEKHLQKKLHVLNSKIEFFRRKNNVLLRISSDSELPSKHQIINYLDAIISIELYNNLKNRYTGRKVIYITEESNVPLMGSIYFGIIDRGTNLLQVRPITGCLLNCPFCSVDEGPRSKSRIIDYIIEPEYLIQETKKIIDVKGVNDIEIHLDGQCEPLTYPYIIELIEAFSNNQNVKVISMQTNGVLLDKKKVQKLEEVGLTRLNLSINTLDKYQARFLAGIKEYNLNKILKIINLIKNSNIDLLIAPVIIPNINEDQIEPIIRFILDKNIKGEWPTFGFQNYVPHKFGRKMNVKPKPFSDFYKELSILEKKYETKLVLTPSDFNIYKTKSVENPIKKNSIVETEIILPGRLHLNDFQPEMLGKAKNRLIHIINCNSNIGDKRKVYVFRNKHNINYAKMD
ncbi:MAG: radical SAM protein [Candidatus Helarchaeota archaeon]